MEQMVIQLQQELFILKAQVAARVQIAAAALEWSAEQTTEFSTECIDGEFLLIRTNQERGAQDLEFTLVAEARCAADAYNAYGYHDWRSERRCCQLAGEPLGDVATSAEEA